MARNIVNIKIDGDSKALYDLQETLNGSNTDISYSPLFKQRKGYTGEPTLSSIVIVLTSPVVLGQFIDLIKHWMTLKHEEKMLQEKIRFTITEEREVRSEELLKLLQEKVDINMME